jgi:hypothetical protein
MNEDIPSSDNIAILCNNSLIGQAYAVFAAPVEAMKQQGLIKMWCVAAGQQGKHILHMLAQRALLEYEEEEIEIEWLPPGKTLTAAYGELTVSLEEGVVLVMDRENQITLIAQNGVNILMMLREFHRYATRMIRLDIRP